MSLGKARLLTFFHRAFHCVKSMQDSLVHTIILQITKKGSKLHSNGMKVLVYFYRKKMKYCWIFDAIGHRAPSMLIRVDGYFEFKIINGVSIISHKYIVQKVAEVCLGPFQKLL